ncbi:MAG TPA: hypothetical protein VG963_13910, partial [Polyangiaceae bacterium]|nr:hypothetical protein [Polyangiaceae bacterium]
QPGVDEVRVEEFRADLSSSWAPLSELVLSLDVPLAIRATTDANLARSGSRGLGEIELRAKWFLWRDRAFAPRWLAAALVTTKLPTAAWYRDAQGRELPPEAQPGTGSLDGGWGASMAGFFGALSGYAALLFRTPLETRAAYRPGSAADATLSLQIQAAQWGAVRGVGALRWDGTAREGGQLDPDSGGLIALAGADVLLGIGVDSQLALGFRLPMVSHSNGAQREGARIGLALMSDW